MRKAALVSAVFELFLGGSAFGFYLLPIWSSPQEHVLAFTQSGSCSPSVWGAPWAVVLNSHTTKAAPASTPLPLVEGTLQANQSDGKFSVIAFIVPDGVYTYSLEPSDFYGQTGTVTVSGTDAIVTVQGPGISCTTTVSS